VNAVNKPKRPMDSRTPKTSKPRGFALVITLSLMVLLTILSVGLLSLSSISLRSTSSADANAQAYANAKLGILLALGELQKQAGDDRRITADASINVSAAQSHMVGAWTSWSPNFVANVAQTATAANYSGQKNDLFRGWLASSPDPDDLKDRSWADSAAGGDWLKLFSLEDNGFDLSVPPVPTEQGAYAWAVSQENTKAKINVAGPDDDKQAPANAALQAQKRPSLASADGLQNPDSDWNRRSARVISFNQVRLDKELAGDDRTLPSTGASFTTQAMGLLTDVVKGGLKTDLNLGFEMGDTSFSQDTWGETRNPFRGSRTGFTVPTNYFRGQKPLFLPFTGTAADPIVKMTLENFAPATIENRFYAGGVPTYDHLRSFYRIPHHLYGSSSSPTVAERGANHIGITLAQNPTGANNFSPASPPKGGASVVGIRPVLNRMVYLLSIAVNPNDKQVRLIMTPIISLWNPYNTALEIDGAVAYPSADVPFQLTWTINTPSEAKTRGVAMSHVMGRQYEPQNHGRSAIPYFMCMMNGSGTATASSVRFEPGEVRVFAPALTTPVEFIRSATNTSPGHIVRMRPVDDISMASTRGGLAIPMSGLMNGGGFSDTIGSSDRVSVMMQESSPGAYHYFLTLEDGYRIRTPVPDPDQNKPLVKTGGQAVTEVQVQNFVSVVNSISSPTLSYAALTNGRPTPFGVLETFHRTAKVNVGNQAVTDLVYTTNPRQSSINGKLANGSFPAAPHYLSTLRGATSFDGAIQTTPDGRRSFWGPSHSASGQTILPFFEIPREPMLSMAGFQHADLASSAFSPAYQVGNSWAPAYLGRVRVGQKTAGTNVPVYDTCYLTNEALWDSFFFSGAAPRLSPGSGGNPLTAWSSEIAKETRSLNDVLQKFVEDPLANPLANPRMRLYKGGVQNSELVDTLSAPAGCAKIAAHLMVDGAFNVNSTDVDAWVAVLSGLRGQDFEVQGGTSPGSGSTAFPRFRFPTAGPDGNWNGFRSLSDGQVRTLATNIVDQVRRRGPFQSLAEFVNRRVENTDLGKSGAIQSAIDAAGFNSSSKQAAFTTNFYPAEARQQIVPDTGVGIPGYLSQADVLQSLAPVITCRSDTFTIRSYGEAKDTNGVVISRAWCEAVVQRIPEFVDPEDSPDSEIASLSEVNQTFGRRFEIVSFRRIPSPEMQASSNG